MDKCDCLSSVIKSRSTWERANHVRRGNCQVQSERGRTWDGRLETEESIETEDEDEDGDYDIGRMAEWL